jgi:hypothetical protein
MGLHSEFLDANFQHLFRSRKNRMRLFAHANAGWSASRNDVTRVQGKNLADEAHDAGDGEDL